MVKKVAGWTLRVLSIILGFWVALVLLMTIVKAWKAGGFSMVQAVLSPFNISYYFQALTLVIPVFLLHFWAQKLLEVKPEYRPNLDETNKADS